MTVDANSGLAINTGINLIINSGGYITDNGQITLNTTAANNSTGLGITGAMTLAGTGNLILNAVPGGSLGTANIFDSGSSNLTQALGHTISGTGQINVNTFTNNGTVNANSSGNTLLLQTNSAAWSNSNLLEATNSGILQLSATTITNTGGTIEANGGTVLLNGGTIAGGTLTSATGSEIDEQGNTTLGGVTISSGSNLKVIDGNNLIFASGSTITNNGTITVNKGGSNIGTGIAIVNNVELAGTGSIVLNANSANVGDANFHDGSSSSLTQDAGHTISGTGEINVNTFTNNGTVNANSSGNTLLLQTNSAAWSNNSLLEATNKGTLEEYSTTINQGTNGTISANGGTVLLNGGTIAGGTLTSATGSEIDEQGNTTLGGVTISSGSNLKVIDGNNLIFASGSTITNNGTITVNKGGSNSATGIAIADSVELAGTGSIVLNANSANVGDANFHDGGSSNLTQDAGHTISGTGEINVNTFTNNGTVNANVSGDTLLLQDNTGTGYTNNNLLEATSGGTLQETNTTINQGTNGLIEAAGGNVLLSGGTISGGTLTSLSGSEIDEQGNTTLAGVTVSSGTNLYVLDGNNLFLNSTTLTNNGTITVNKGGSNTGTGIAIFNSVELAGTGSIVLNANGTGVGNANIHDGGSSNLTQDAGHTISGTGEINVNTFTNNGTVNANVSGDTLALISNSSTYTNNGIYEASNGGTLDASRSNLTNYSAGTTTLTGGTYEVSANSTMILPGSITVNDGNIILSGTHTTIAAITPLNNNEGGFHLINGASFTTAGNLTNSGTIETTAASTLTVTGTFTQTAGTTMDNGTITTTTMNLQGGTLAGTGSVSGTVDNTGGIISPGDAPGTLTLGSLDQSSAGIVDILLASLTSFDQLNVTGLATIGGTLNVSLAAGFSAPNNSTFDILKSAGLSGTFSTVNLPSDFSIAYTSTDVILNYINNSGPSPVPTPASAGLLALGALGLLAYRQISLRKRRRMAI